MKITFLVTLLVVLCSQGALASYPTTGNPQDDYCQVPPYVTQHVKPNINLVLDVSGSMGQPAYMSCSRSDTGIVAGCINTLDSSQFYDASRDYYGYFNSDKYYRYDSGNSCFADNSGNCAAYTDRKGSTGGCMSGNLLNWIVTTRVDTMRKVLTGGRVRSGSNNAATAVLESDGGQYTFTDTALQCTFQVTATNNNPSAGNTLPRKLTVTDQSKNKPCALGTMAASHTNVQTSVETVKGVIQGIYDSADLEVSVFGGSIAGYRDAVQYRVGKGAGLDSYVTAINSELTYGATPTGSAMKQAKGFFQQNINVVTGLTTSNAAKVYGKADYRYDPYYDKNSVASPADLPIPCRKSFVLLISDGMWPNISYSAANNSPEDPVQYVHSMRTADLRTEAPLQPDRQVVTTYVVYAYGDGDFGRNSLIATAIFGGYHDLNASGWPYPFTALPADSRSTAGSGNTTPYALSRCQPEGSWDDGCAEWDMNRKGIPYNYFEGDDGAALQSAINGAVSDIFSRASSGSAASVLGNNDSAGAILLQAMYYPDRHFADNTRAAWTGESQALWYYVPVSRSSDQITIREDTNGDKKLKLSEDRIAVLAFNKGEDKIEIELFDSDDTGNALSSAGKVNPQEVKALWRAGRGLWSRPPFGSGGRTVLTKDLNAPASAAGLMAFGTGNTQLLAPRLDVANNNADADSVIRYTLGADLNTAGYRNRTVTIGDKSNVWKLGDIINSTPRMLSTARLNTYNDRGPAGYDDESYGYFVNSLGYRQRGVAFVGANDGMLHTFKVGLNRTGKSGFRSELLEADGKTVPADLGKELWAYVPQNALPYLKHLGNPSYKHLFYVDSTPLLVDASIGRTKYLKKSGTGTEILTCDDGITGQFPYYVCAKTSEIDGMNNLVYDISGSPAESKPGVGTSWRTILLGSMGWGGATREAGSPCGHCVKEPAGVVAGSGLSSYFALDVTRPDDPGSVKLLWEFSHPRLGFSSVRPAVLRIKDPTDDGKPERNGRWFVVLASGPTGPIDPATNQMKGYSDQPLTLFVLDLKTGTPLRTFSRDAAPVIPGVGHTQAADMPAYAFGGTFSDAAIDTDKGDLGPNKPVNYSDDAVYIGYTMKDTTSGSPSYNKYARGGVLRMLTGDGPDPATWKVSKVIDGIGPVSAAVKKLQDRHRSNVNERNLWLYFGTGRYFHKSGSLLDEDYSDQEEAIYGIKEPCYNRATNDLDAIDCTASVSSDSLVDQSTSISEVPAAVNGWQIKLGKASGGFGAKRVITSPVTAATGAVFFLTFKPSGDVCGYGGESSLWAVEYDRGGSLAGINLQGQALIQLSTGGTRQIDLTDEFTEHGNRETGSFPGVTSRDEPPIISNGNHFPSRRILHVRER